MRSAASVPSETSTAPPIATDTSSVPSAVTRQNPTSAWDGDPSTGWVACCQYSIVVGFRGENRISSS